MNTEFGAWLFQWRISQRLSVRALGDKLRVSGAYVSALETGRNVVSQAFLDKLFDLYPELATKEILSYFKKDIQNHKKLKKSRADLIVWARALASLDDAKQTENIRKVLKENGIDIPKQKINNHE